MFENALREVIKLDDVQKFKALLYGKDGTYKLDDKYLTQICALLDSPGCMAQAILMGQPVNLDDSDEMCPLNCASFSGSVETAALLIEAGAHPNSVYKGETALMMAIRNSTIDHVKMLLDANADLARIEYAARYALHPDELIPFIDNGDKKCCIRRSSYGRQIR
ncbi:Serine/threonine-protein phosphatase 6 regulatory ankyrin repeat subunit B [Histomonas meleagridis]|uniref:Serine/threonine-protein phosphatase 6 regulatory ankyrin repeat subunit B n=1 Tax=Histomonas meleagridis TaxID=135588 RepID=UPI00355976C3|nr:Serine/threonine-protein phosphatase 6 regulatory ankyrin repeat subunit B [Histomonas meleagridis]